MSSPAVISNYDRKYVRLSGRKYVRPSGSISARLAEKQWANPGLQPPPKDTHEQTA